MLRLGLKGERQGGPSKTLCLTEAAAGGKWDGRCAGTLRIIFVGIFGIGRQFSYSLAASYT